jgi:hypothetical protein
MASQLRRLGVRVLFDCEYRETNDKGLVLVRDEEEQFVEADTIITANHEPVSNLYQALQGKVDELYLAGDARSVQVQFLTNIHGPYRLALKI